MVREHRSPCQTCVGDTPVIFDQVISCDICLHFINDHRDVVMETLLNCTFTTYKNNPSLFISQLLKTSIYWVYNDTYVERNLGHLWDGSGQFIIQLLIHSNWYLIISISNKITV